MQPATELPISRILLTPMSSTSLTSQITSSITSWTVCGIPILPLSTLLQYILAEMNITGQTTHTRRTWTTTMHWLKQTSRVPECGENGLHLGALPMSTRTLL